MDVLAFLLVLIFLFYMVNATAGNKQSQASQPDKLVVEKKKCPPHAWRWQEIVDQDGNKIAERIVCDHCGPLTASESLKDGI